MSLVYISAFYKADRPGGLYVRISQQNLEDLGEALKQLRAAWDKLWRGSVDNQTTYGLVRALEYQLFEIGVRRRTGRSSQEDVVKAIANIDLLQRVGQLKSDEYNGIVLYYQEGLLVYPEGK